MVRDTDHIKVSKEELRMPGIQVMRQETENSVKSGYITGHQSYVVDIVCERGQYIKFRQI
jgi:hypothetical protein